AGGQLVGLGLPLAGCERSHLVLAGRCLWRRRHGGDGLVLLLEIDRDRLQIGRGGIRRGARRRELQGDVVPALAGVLPYFGATCEIEPRWTRIGDGDGAGIVAMRSGRFADVGVHSTVMT